MAPTESQIQGNDLHDGEPSYVAASDGSYEDVDTDVTWATPTGLLSLSDCQARLRESLSLLPLFLFQQFRGSEIRKYVYFLVHQTKNDIRARQRLYYQVMAKLKHKQEDKQPTYVEFKAFWLHLRKQLSQRQREHLEEAEWLDLAVWDTGDTGAVDLDREWRRMEAADSDAKEQLSEAQYIWRQRLLLVKVLEVTRLPDGGGEMVLDIDMPRGNGTRCEESVAAKLDECKESIVRASRTNTSAPPASTSSLVVQSAPRTKPDASPGPSPSKLDSAQSKASAFTASSSVTMHNAPFFPRLTPATVPTAAPNQPGDANSVKARQPRDDDVDDLADAMREMHRRLQGKIDELEGKIAIDIG
ncbi:hypothetical protein IMZ48_14405, partial [Candidatus Bathyarchaeota archaeon]|nr:hypothetical protein [Candidatus Bathyarchaeota archaeon]